MSMLVVFMQLSQTRWRPHHWYLSVAVQMLIVVIGCVLLVGKMSLVVPDHTFLCRGTSPTPGSRWRSSSIHRKGKDLPERADAASMQKASEWRLKVGHAIDVLSTDLKLFGSEQMPDLSIFSEDIVFADARLPELRLQGLAAYKSIVSTLKWSLRASCDESRSEITALHAPVNGEVYMRWRLILWPKNVLASLGNNPGEPIIVEGYSRYEFDSWSGEIVKHTIDITNPPTLIMDMYKQQMGSFSWKPVGVGLGVPSRR
mmetsp:Transcript_136463/g.272163  ORF Transcript_136463/g.272163 Transcript_136463/m.272163 type:complete len:258 (+) Transcript_136463:55-828(+)